MEFHLPKKVFLLVTAVLLVLVSGIAIAAVNAHTIVDTFNLGAVGGGAQFVCDGGSVCAGLGNPNSSTEDTADLGIERDLTITRVTGGAEVNIKIDEGDSNLLAFSQDAATSGTASVVWDGDDNSTVGIVEDGLCSSPGCPRTPSPTGVDLTGAATNDGFHVEIPSNDNPIDLTVNVYSGDQNNYKTYTLNLPGGIASGSHVDFFIPFSSFSNVGTGADFDNVGAISLFIDGTLNEAADMSLDMFEADNFRDYGDAPATYGTPSHVADGVRLGLNMDIEEFPNYSPNADGDDLDQPPNNDEDGVARTPGVNWSVAGGGSLDVVVNGCAGICYINGWVDWDGSGTFEPGEQILTDVARVNGTYSGATLSPITFSVPSGTAFNTSYVARFRICDATSTCNSATATDILGGEVEDYYWGFGPNAIQLAALGARSNPSNMNALLLAGGLLLVLAGWGTYAKLRRRA